MRIMRLYVNDLAEDGGGWGLKIGMLTVI